MLRLLRSAKHLFFAAAPLGGCTDPTPLVAHRAGDSHEKAPPDIHTPGVAGSKDAYRLRTASRVGRTASALMPSST